MATLERNGDDDWASLVRAPLVDEIGASPDGLAKLAARGVAHAVRHPAAPRGGEPYSRTLLHRDPGGEVLLATWGEGARCAPHDHGLALGLVLLLRGRFTERTWAMSGAGLVVTRTRTFAAPARLPVGEGSIHDMHASDGGLSLHIYRPSIRQMRVFDVTRRETLVVTDDSGAWVPTDARQILSREGWGPT